MKNFKYMFAVSAAAILLTTTAFAAPQEQSGCETLAGSHWTGSFYTSQNVTIDQSISSVTFDHDGAGSTKYYKILDGSGNADFTATLNGKETHMGASYCIETDNGDVAEIILGMEQSHKDNYVAEIIAPPVKRPSSAYISGKMDGHDITSGEIKS